MHQQLHELLLFITDVVSCCVHRSAMCVLLPVSEWAPSRDVCIACWSSPPSPLLLLL